MEASDFETSGNGFHPSNNNCDLLAVAQVAQRLHAHPHSVRRWADAGVLNCYRIGIRGDRRFKLQDVDRFIRARSKLQRMPT